MNRVIATAGILVTVGLALRPEPRTVLLKTAEETITFDSAAQTATVHAVLRNNTRDTTWFLSCLAVPAFAIERHVAGHWIADGAFPCPARPGQVSPSRHQYRLCGPLRRARAALTRRRAAPIIVHATTDRRTDHH